MDRIAATGAGTRNLLQEAWCQQLAQTMARHSGLAALLPPDSVAVQCTYFEKSPERNWLVALHQDLSIPVRQQVAHPELHVWSQKEQAWFVQPPAHVLAQLVAVRVHIDPCGPDDGPLKVVPGTHTLGVLTAPQAQHLRDTKGETVCLAHPGDALVMRPLLLHASSKAQGHSRRRVLHFVWGPAKLPWGLQWP